MDIEELNERIANLFEPKPEQTLTYRQLEKLDRESPMGGKYSCWRVNSPKWRWIIDIDWGDVQRYGREHEVPDWKPNFDLETDDNVLEIAYEVEEKIKEMGLTNKYIDALVDVVGVEFTPYDGENLLSYEQYYAIIHASASDRCKAALKAVEGKR
jgi:hypothetical protein